jgi:hypothetical protein
MHKCTFKQVWENAQQTMQVEVRTDRLGNGCFDPFIITIIICGTGLWTQVLMLAKQSPATGATPQARFTLCFFSDLVSNVLSRLAFDMDHIPLTYVLCLAGPTGGTITQGQRFDL